TARYTLSLHDALPICEDGGGACDAPANAAGATSVSDSTSAGSSTASQQPAAPPADSAITCTGPPTTWWMNSAITSASSRAEAHRSEEHTSELQSPYDL